MPTKINTFDDRSMEAITREIRKLQREVASLRSVLSVVQVASPRLAIFPFVLTEDIGATTSGKASADQLDWDFSTVKKSGITVLDNGAIFDGGTDTTKGILIKVKKQRHIIQLGC